LAYFALSWVFNWIFKGSRGNDALAIGDLASATGVYTLPFALYCPDMLANPFENRVVAITGGTGSFGNAVVGHLLAHGVKRIHVLSRDEAKQDEMRQRIRDDRLHFWVGDVRDIRSLQAPLKGVDVVFHAAALKQVPSCEFFPEQAVMTNVLGSRNVLETASQMGVQRVVCLSTDKAVQPVNAMGMSKALMEKQVQALARRFGDSATVVCCVRYGNVLYSRGSVIPLFVQKIIDGQSLPITHFAMTRFLLPLSQAVGLVETALLHGQQGDLFIRKSPAATVRVIVDALFALAGRKVATHLIGVRHGEKIHETLATAEEMAKAIDLGDHWRIPMDVRALNYSEKPGDSAGPVDTVEPFTSDTARQLDVNETVALLRNLPELQPVLAQLSQSK
jgi:UDP-N-acetylglucosamine 4,6-dehydratase/5-epimerase